MGDINQLKSRTLEFYQSVGTSGSSCKLIELLKMLVVFPFFLVVVAEEMVVLSLISHCGCQFVMVKECNFDIFLLLSVSARNFMTFLFIGPDPFPIS